MTLVYSPDGGVKTTMDCLEFIEDSKSKIDGYNPDQIRDFMDKIEQLDYQIVYRLDEMIDECSDISEITAAAKLKESKVRDMNMELATNRFMRAGVVAWIDETLYTFGIE